MTVPPTNDRVFLAHFCREACRDRDKAECPKNFGDCRVGDFAVWRGNWQPVKCWAPNTSVDSISQTTYKTNISTPPPPRGDIPEGE